MEKENEPTLKWDNILPPNEMKQMFGPQYTLFGIKEGEYFVNSDYFVKEALKVKHEKAKDCVREIERIYLSLAKDIRLMERKKSRPTMFDGLNKAKIRHQSSGNF